MQTRPKIKLTPSPLDLTLERTGKIFLILMWVITIYTYLKLPSTIPTHFNAGGQPDDYGKKIILLILPFLATIIYFGLTKLNNYPHIFNYMTTITEENAEKQYTIATRLLRYMKVAILFIFSLIILFVYLTTTGVTNGLGIWFLPLTISLLLIPTIITITQSLKKKNG